MEAYKECGERIWAKTKGAEDPSESSNQWG